MAERSECEEQVEGEVNSRTEGDRAAGQRDGSGGWRDEHSGTDEHSGKSNS
jgi:hypothetical protein